MNTSQGIVKAVSERPAGKGMAYNFCLEDGTWYGFGFSKPSFGRGDYIRFVWSANGQYKNVDAASVEILDNPTGTPPAETTTSAASQAPAAGKTNWDEKDKRITLLACRKDAIEITKMALEQGALKLGSTAKDKYGILMDAIDTTAADLYYGVYGDDFPTFTRTVEAEDTTNDTEE